MSKAYLRDWWPDITTNIHPFAASPYRCEIKTRIPLAKQINKDLAKWWFVLRTRLFITSTGIPLDPVSFHPKAKLYLFGTPQLFTLIQYPFAGAAARKIIVSSCVFVASRYEQGCPLRERYPVSSRGLPKGTLRNGLPAIVQPQVGDKLARNG